MANNQADEQRYQMAISIPLDRKIEKAIATFQHYNDAARSWDMFEPWIHLCMSYGKDSIVLEWLAARAGVDYKCYHNLTTLDPPELIQFGRKHYPETIISMPKVPLLKRMSEKGPPTRIVRWCCEEYKERGCFGQIKALGVRAEESFNRKSSWRIWQPHKADGSWILNPILYWTEEDIWTLIRQERIPYCCLYDEGFRRLGCIGCPMAGKGRCREFERWPKYADAWQRAFEQYWDRWHGVPLQRPRWVSREGKYPFQPLHSELPAQKYVEASGVIEMGFWTLRRWFDLREYETWQELWAWWMEDEEEPEGCGMGMS